MNSINFQDSTSNGEGLNMPSLAELKNSILREAGVEIEEEVQEEGQIPQWRLELAEINKDFDYEFKFDSERGFHHFFKSGKVIDLSVSREECIENGWPYLDREGRLRNTDAFTKTGRTLQETGDYQKAPEGSYQHMEFWKEQKRRCREGYKLGQVRVTGINYFFLNFFCMTIYNKKEKQEIRTLPFFITLQFNFFHLLDFCELHAKDLCLIKPRGVGLSECAAAVGVYSFFIVKYQYDGSLLFEENTFYAYEDRYLSDADGLYDKMTKGIDWLNKRGQRAMVKEMGHTMDNTKMTLVAGNRTKSNEKVQTGGSISCKVLKKPDHARGGRQTRLFWEESGANPHLGKALNVAKGRLKRLGEKTGIQVIWGTSNAEKKGIEAFQLILSNPVGYECLSFRDIWADIDLRKDEEEVLSKLANLPKYPFEHLLDDDKDLEGIGWFIPYYDILKRDEDGNPKRIEAMEAIIQERKGYLDNTAEGDSNILIHIADYPISMQEALMKSGDSPFTCDELIEQSQYLKFDPEAKGIAVRGRLEWVKKPQNNKGGEVKFIPDPKGDHVVSEQPIRNVHGKRYKKAYIAGIDSIDKGEVDSQVGKDGSDFCILIKKRSIGMGGNSYIAYYKKRPNFAHEAYEEAAKLMCYYGCQGNLEDSKTNIVTYYREKGWLHLLYPQPMVARANKYKRTFTGKFGVPPHEKYIRHSHELIISYVNAFASKIYLLELVTELLEYDYEKKTKFDMIAAMQMCEIGDEDMMTSVVKDEMSVEGLSNTIGFYINSQGKKRYGAIPLEKSVNFAKDSQQKSEEQFYNYSTNSIDYAN